MKSPAHRQFVAAIFALLVAICYGCNQHTAGRSPAVSDTVKHGPKERLQQIMDSFKHNVEEPQIGFVVSDGGSRSTMFGTNKVSYELVPPAKPEEPYKAVVTVVSESHYSLRRSKSTSDENEKDQNSKNQSKSTLAEPGDKKGVDILDPSLAGSSGSDSSSAAVKSKQPDEDIVARRPDKEERKYELIYNNDRWSLVTKLDPKIERSIQFAFDEALSRQ
jgi:hypothetical protein